MDSSSQLSDQVRECAQRIAESSAAALAGLYDLSARRLVRFSVTITCNQHDAEDAVQTVLVRVASDPARLLDAAQPWPYLLTMVRNESLLARRRKQRWTFLDNLTDLVTRRSIDELALEDTHRAVWRALRKLPTEQSEVVVLKVWEELSFAQIAKVLEIPAPTAASRYRYALEKLAIHLRGSEVEVDYGA